MLKVFFGQMEGAIYNTSMFFNNAYLDNWLEKPLSQMIIKDVDKATVLSNKAIDSKALGIIPVTQLSGGTKTLLLMLNKPERIYNASTCGDNCAKWILKIAKEIDADLTINLHHIMIFPETNFEMEIINNGVVVNNMSELTEYAGALLRENYLRKS